MTTFWGKLIKGDKILKQDTYQATGEDLAAELLDCIEHFSRTFDIEAPMWQTTHTKQMGIFKKATFRPDDFIDRVDFDRFEIQIIDDKDK